MTGTTLSAMPAGQRVPGASTWGEAGHVGHRAPGGEIGEDDLLARSGEDVGGLAMKCTPQNTTWACRAAAACAGELNESR